ncbi:M15 family metallopeptidase [Halomonas binhaiensis]|uniref:D-alanyl-D-alanine dipeptidase n=1 Tax=Halomonas binhaiensis TaxID=2562282 RepID=A0A5C1NKX8_9GAMM|nr:M15 family metallopeptidase [Halomonas binhaiensis]QEM83440.1 M15 family metallopeptidase [Halomonas binhaiensis]
MTSANSAIPARPDPVWDEVSALPIQGDDSALIPMSLTPLPIRVYPAYAKLGIPGAIPECYVRPEVHRRLLMAAHSLPAGVSLVVLDAWRPWRVQQYLFETLFEAIGTQHPEYDEAALLTHTREFVSLPSRDPQAPSPHLTGGAVDVTLCDQEGRLLEMGTGFDEAITASHTDHFERHAPQDERQRLAHKNRRLLHHVMLTAGFTNLPSEWWHYDFGDQLWAWYRGEAAALYGPAEVETLESRWRKQLCTPH